MNMLRRPTVLLGAVVLIAAVALLGGLIASASAGGDNGISPEKQAALDKYNHDQKVAQTQRHAPKNPNASVPVDTASSSPQGIFPYRIGPFRGGLYDIANVASIRTTNGADLVVYAGALASDPTQGILVVMSHAGNSVEVPADAQAVYLSPERGGALTMTALGSNSIIFTYALGGSGTFNLLSKKFS